ncbi:MAG: YggT family protein [Salibaculum sp.]|jgi:YggT family protein|uniref:YggT family protein n=1 Tax=Roseovarius halophilus (ex Wu et al. 2025) TaxID=3376060 RepID=UPI00286FD5F5|nr:YggT family protein [Salibaculum sp.]MDR9428309.1 YggT family protein [Salibaculum sp.]MDR9482628.1 YggT family protein [Salibaculum sp.]
MNDLQQIALLLIGVVRFFIIVHFIMSWLINFQVLNIRQPFVYQVWSGLNRLMEPIYAPIRSVLPQMGGIDLSPLVALIGLEILRILII